uniref:Salivary lipocalin n=2 Tax=Triatoma infestans TaxID=30076 RepID=A6YPH2_TRIIF|nr:salivary lipocalin [Triatoma infestans]
MKTTFAVTFFGILMYAVDQVSPQTTKCEQYKTMETFNPSDFFMGSWFVTHAKRGSQSTTACRTFITGLKKEIITFNGDGYYGDKEPATYYQVRCTGDKKRGRGGKFSLSCTRQQPSMPGTSPQNKIAFNMELSIIDTDYGQYAIVQTCSTYPSLGTTKDNVLVLHRNKDALKSDIETIFKQKTGSSLATYITRQKDTKCKVA